MDEKTIARFWSKVEKREGADCWEWQAYVGKSGYGRFGVGPVVRYAHHVAWEITHGERGKLWVLHRCDNRRCVNPSHLFLGTHDDNMRDMREKGRSPCSGARLTPEQVQEIRALYVPRKGVSALARRFGIERRAVWNIGAGKAWQGVK